MIISSFSFILFSNISNAIAEHSELWLESLNIRHMLLLEFYRDPCITQVHRTSRNIKCFKILDILRRLANFFFFSPKDSYLGVLRVFLQVYAVVGVGSRRWRQSPIFHRLGYAGALPARPDLLCGRRKRRARPIFKIFRGARPTPAPYRKIDDWSIFK